MSFNSEWREEPILPIARDQHGQLLSDNLSISAFTVTDMRSIDLPLDELMNLPLPGESQQGAFESLALGFNVGEAQPLPSPSHSLVEYDRHQHPTLMNQSHEFPVPADWTPRQPLPDSAPFFDQGADTTSFWSQNPAFLPEDWQIMTPILSDLDGLGGGSSSAAIEPSQTGYLNHPDNINHPNNSGIAYAELYGESAQPAQNSVGGVDFLYRAPGNTSWQQPVDLSYHSHLQTLRTPEIQYDDGLRLFTMPMAHYQASVANASVRSISSAGVTPNLDWTLATTTNPSTVSNSYYSAATAVEHIQVTQDDLLGLRQSVSSEANRRSANRVALVSEDSQRLLKEPTSKNWDRLRPVIYSLYTRMKLTQVKETLKDKYGLKTSEKMLKDHIRRWDQDKNIKPHEMEALLRRLSIRESVHKRSEIRVRGRIFSMEKVIRHRKRKPCLRLEVARVRSPTPPGLEIYTPPASPLAMPDTLKLPEETMKCIRDYISGAFEGNVWISAGDYEELEINQRSPNTFDSADFDSLMNTILSYITREDLDAAERLLLTLCRRLEDLIRVQDDNTVTYFLWLIYKFARRGKLNSVIPTIERLSAMTIRVLTHAHPLAHIYNLVLSYLRELESGSILPAVGTAMRSIVDGFKYSLGPLHYSTMGHQNLHTMVVVMHRDPEKALSEVRKFKYCCDAEFRGPQDLRPLLARVHLMSTLALRGSDHFHEAIHVAAEILEKTRQQEFPSRWAASYQREAHCFMGIGQMELGKVDSGTLHLTEAIDITIRAYGARDAKVLYLCNKLEHYLRRWGRLEAADEMARRSRTILEGVADNVVP